ncbi:MAG: hypothetical protein JWQ87_4754 [Candidatus Sulfotelmatobacter sp.]|nr:hypothetical protein [Candidatus Sulfotelmatobacter sp.]
MLQTKNFNALSKSEMPDIGPIIFAICARINSEMPQLLLTANAVTSEIKAATRQFIGSADLFIGNGLSGQSAAAYALSASSRSQSELQ